METEGTARSSAAEAAAAAAVVRPVLERRSLSLNSNFPALHPPCLLLHRGQGRGMLLDQGKGSLRVDVGRTGWKRVAVALGLRDPSPNRPGSPSGRSLAFWTLKRSCNFKIHALLNQQCVKKIEE